MSLLAFLSLEMFLVIHHVSGKCKRYRDAPLDTCDEIGGEYSAGFFCEYDVGTETYTVISKFWESSNCPTTTPPDDLFSIGECTEAIDCHCDGDIDDCNVAEEIQYGYDDTSGKCEDWFTKYLYVTDECIMDLQSGGSFIVKCDKDRYGGVYEETYSCSDCSGCDGVTPSPITPSGRLDCVESECSNDCDCSNLGEDSSSDRRRLEDDSDSDSDGDDESDNGSDNDGDNDDDESPKSGEECDCTEDTGGEIGGSSSEDPEVNGDHSNGSGNGDDAVNNVKASHSMISNEAFRINIVEMSMLLVFMCSLL